MKESREPASMHLQKEVKGSNPEVRKICSREAGKSVKLEPEFGHFNSPGNGEVGRWIASKRGWLGLPALS